MGTCQMNSVSKYGIVSFQRKFYQLKMNQSHSYEIKDNATFSCFNLDKKKKKTAKTTRSQKDLFLHYLSLKKNM